MTYCPQVHGPPALTGVWQSTKELDTSTAYGLYIPLCLTYYPGTLMIHRDAYLHQGPIIRLFMSGSLFCQHLAEDLAILLHNIQLAAQLRHLLSVQLDRTTAGDSHSRPAPLLQTHGQRSKSTEINRPNCRRQQICKSSLLRKHTQATCPKMRDKSSLLILVFFNSEGESWRHQSCYNVKT